MWVRPPNACATRSCSPASIPSSDRSTSSASSASDSGSILIPCRPQSVRSVAVTIALDPPSPTALGMSVSYEIAKVDAETSSPRSAQWSAKRLIAAVTRRRPP